MCSATSARRLDEQETHIIPTLRPVLNKADEES